MYYQLRRSRRRKSNHIRITFKRYSTLWRLICNTFMKTINFIISVPVILVLLLVMPITLMFKWIVSFVHRIASLGVLGNLMSNDEIRWLGDSWSQSTVFVVFVLDSEIELGYLQELVTKRVLSKCPRLKERPVVLTNVFGNSYCWMSEGDSFNINHHVYNISTRPMEKREIQGYISQLVSRGLSIEKSPWELHLLSQNNESMNGKRDSVVIFIAHRCLADWMSLAKLLCTCLSDTKTYYHLSDKPTKIRYLTSILRTIMTGPAELLWKMISTIKDNSLVTSDSLSLNYNVNWSCFQGALSKLNRINQVTKTPHNYIVLSAVAGSIHTMMKLYRMEQLDNMNIVYPIQIGNNDYTSPVLVQLPTGIEGAIPRLWFTKKAMKNMYRSDQSLLQAIVSLLMPLNASGTRMLLSELTDNLASVQFSWLAGPRSRVLIKGSPLKTVYSILPSQKNIGVSISVFIYTDDLFVSVAVDNAIGEAFGKTLLKNIKQQIDQMYELLRYRRLSKDTKVISSLPSHFKDLAAITIRDLVVKMRDIQLQLQMSKELGAFDDDAIRYVNQLKEEYLTLLRELRKRKQIGQRKGIFQTCNFTKYCTDILERQVGDTSPLQTSVRVREMKNLLVTQTTQEYRPRIHICRAEKYEKENFLSLPKIPRKPIITQI
ncbi:uncharacterized protein LOC126907119 [Daktulosphaira vitifoliae]|uniref:uncharacterized protein LOC126907119 n=1 Tax=Daktulosphaira vitifoliae TaxID=58002 RepID=UPI0021AAFF9F|nr:uncharacterized protein LOC126907119 [Daktulosphaira vitifoliae]